MPKSLTKSSTGEKSTIKRPSDHSYSGRSTGSVTLEDVAKLAGVSPITVSRAVNHPNKLAPKTLEKINQAIARTGYVPNLLAGGLASRKSRLIAAVIPYIANSVYAETIQYLSDRFREFGYQVLLGESGYDEAREDSLVTAVLSRRPDGIILTGVHHSIHCRRLLSSANIPVVETWDITPTPLDIAVGFSHEAVGRSVADFVLKKNYQRIAILTADDHRAQIRNRSFVETLRKNGLMDVSVSTVSTPTNFRKGREGLARLLDNDFKGVVFCSSDTLAQGALAEAQSRGLGIPDQIAIVGFGDQPYAAYTYPALTTVRFDRAAIGYQAADALISRINGEPVKEHVIDVGFAIVERQTA